MGEETGAAVDVVLDDAGPRRAGVIQLVRRYRMADLNAKQVSKLVDAAPTTVISGMARVQAEAIKIELEALGAVVQLNPADR